MRSPVEERGQQLEEHLEVLPGGQQLLDAHHGDQDLREGRAHAPVALGLDHAHRPRLGDREVGPADPHRDREELRAQVRPGGGGESLGIVGEILDPQLGAEEVADLGPVAVDGGHEDVRGAVVGELDDELGQVGLDGVDAVGLQRRVEVDLVGGQRLDLDDLPRAMGADHVGHHPVGLGAVARPVHRPARPPGPRPPGRGGARRGGAGSPP